MNNSNTYQCIIIGGGAAGLKVAGLLGQKKVKTLLLEHNSSLGRKILISGGGRCNFTNMHACANDYISQNPHFVKSALSQYTAQNFIDEVTQANIPFYEKKLGQLFCKRSAQDILNLLINKIDQTYVSIGMNQTVSSITKPEDNFILTLSTSKTYKCKQLIIATGGLSFSKLGASDFGYTIAKQFGHSIIKPEPALDGFKVKESDLKKFSLLAGVSLPVAIEINQYSIKDDLLFTHQGLSGPAALKASLYWYDKSSVNINFLPQFSSSVDLEKELQQQKHTYGHKLLKSFLKPLLPQRFIENFIEQALLNKKMAELSNPQLHAVATLITQYTLIPKKTIGYHKAEVTRGGVCTKNISSKTMESKLCQGLYFIGEVVDVTGQLGGFNFQWAWSSAYACANHIS
ncbi:MAG TPA: NAD(P)/FAD-dependent oxidoreductase [Oligoflexia bacterium]|nr:NAD(P)/FAD-dependent oxidoreductase [Oligoflexia bacterium]HMR24622.1 NAD(P)/FAD-dependent oxidoreductase [Oligoflexia bacterium]